MPMFQAFMPNFYPQYNAQPAYQPFYQQQNSIFQGYQTPPMNQGEIKGKILFQNALAGIPQNAPDPPMCARYVKNAIVNSGLGVYELGNGEETKYMLRKNMNFQEVKVKGKDLKYLPEGTVITYDAFDSGVVGEDGHVIVKGKGNCAVSDRYETSIIPSDNAHVFLLV